MIDADTIILPHEDDEPLVSSPSDVEEFRKSVIWQDMRQMLTENVEYLQNQLVAENDPVQLRRLQGKVTGLKECLELPDRILQHLEYQANGRRLKEANKQNGVSESS